MDSSFTALLNLPPTRFPAAAALAPTSVDSRRSKDGVVPAAPAEALEAVALSFLPPMFDSLRRKFIVTQGAGASPAHNYLRNARDNLGIAIGVALRREWHISAPPFYLGALPGV